MTKHNENERLERFNVVLSIKDTAWLDQLAGEMLAGAARQLTSSSPAHEQLASSRAMKRRCPKVQ